ncbi:MAG: hypothetical protein R6V02_07010 [Candidatus Aminicenantes bacterium]
MLTVLKYSVALAAVYSMASLGVLIIKAGLSGSKQLYSRPAGKTRNGVLYAFGKGMSPWEKESTKKHLPTYFSGIIYHAGIFTAFFMLALRLISVDIIFPDMARIFLASGLAAGMGLLIKRASLSYMKKISSPDDYISNLLVDFFVLSALLNTWVSAALPFFYLSAFILLVYIPMGKIRHCLFFFYSRVLFGKFFGRRGVYPPKKKVYLSK